MGKKTNYNRGERYNACVAYLDGLDHLPSIVMQRGYYTQAYFWAVDWDGTNLTTRWLHRGQTASTWDVVDASGNTAMAVQIRSNNDNVVTLLDLLAASQSATSMTTV